jgi:hypothetical protein
MPDTAVATSLSSATLTLASVAHTSAAGKRFFPPTTGRRDPRHRLGHDEGMTESTDPGAGHRVVTVGPDGRPVSDDVSAQPATADDDTDDTSVADMVEHPAKVMRIGTMIKQLLEEVRAAPLDDASRVRLRQIHESSIKELSEGLAPELRDELHRMALPFSADAVPSDAELRVAQAQLVGWLEGLFHGIQTALFAQQMAARAQLEEMRRQALPMGAVRSPGQPEAPTRTGPYL